MKIRVAPFCPSQPGLEPWQRRAELEDWFNLLWSEYGLSFMGHAGNDDYVFMELDGKIGVRL